MTAGFIGPAAIWAAMSLATIAVISGRRRALTWSAVSASVAVVALGGALLTGDFSLDYVARTTSLATPWPYRLAALWGGMDGSMLFYTALALAVAAIGARSRSEVRASAGVSLGLLAVTMLFANPFVVTDVPAVDGQGLLAILQHPAMIYHPPLLYLGLVVLVVPFASTVAGRDRQSDRALWLRGVRRWLYVSWTLLTFGMVAGANWAYVELGWGGFWAWDPVENTALMPWLAATVFLHTSRMEESTGRWRRWNVFFAGLPFALSVMGVYLTRSGATGSIHSFAEDPVVGRVLLVSAVVLAAVVALSAARSPAGAPWRAIRLDHSGWLGVNALLVTAVLVFVTAGSAYPAFVSVFADESIVVDSRFFVLTVLPVAMLIAVSIGAALRARMPIAAGIGVLTLALALLAAGLRPGVFLLAPALASFVVIGLRLVEKRPRGRILTAHLAHLGMALFLVGVAGSSLGEDFSGSMMPGDAVVVAGHEIVLEDVRTGESERFVFVRAGFTVDGERLEPEIRAYEDQASPVAEPVLRSTVVADVIVAVSLLFPDGNTVAVSVFVRPLVWLVWAGALLMGLAGLVALFSRAGAGARRRRGATEARQPEGTTSGTASP